MDESVELNELSNEQTSCGRVSFREADLAYLLIDKERMFPLAELLASLFSTTARTTLFTRMEKINTRRHFCNAEEIRLLKTVNGIHGSSAICTLIPEADVQKYCGVYVDRTIDLKQFAKGKRTRKLTAKDKRNCKSKVSESSKSTTTVNNDEENQTVRNSRSSNDNVNIINSLKRKNRATNSRRRVNGEAKVKVFREEENKFSDNESLLLGEVFGSEDSHSPSLSEHVTNGTQTVSLLSEPVVKPRKKRKAKDCLGNDCKDHIEQNKRPRNADEIVSTLYPPSKASIEKKNGIVNSDGNGAAVGSCSSTVSLENSNSSCLAQCLTNANSEILFSDSSSNDSGFGSTTLSLASTCTSHSSTAKDKPNKKLAIPKKIKLTLPSPTKLNKNKGPKKIKLQQGFDCKNMGKLVDPSLSPPALVIKRQNNTWQVKTKTELDSKAKPPRKIPKTVKKKLKWSSSESLEAQTLHLQNAISNGKNVLKNKRRQKKVISDKVNGTVHVESKRNVVKKKRMRRRKQKNVDELVESSPSSFITTSIDSETFIYSGSKKKGLSRKSGSKEGKNPEKIRTSQTPEKIKGAHSCKSNIAMTTSTSSALHSSLNSVCRKNTCAGKNLKANKNFKLMSLFSGFPFLCVQDGDLSPTSTMSVPDNVKKPLSHPIWKWHLGGPVINHQSKRKTNTS